MDALEGTLQGGYSRVIAPDGRDIAAAPEGRGEPLVLADLGATLHHQLAWSGAGLLRSCAPCAPCWKPTVPLYDTRYTRVISLLMHCRVPKLLE
eukprot:1568308-Prymnesium_polylepis.1